MSSDDVHDEREERSAAEESEDREDSDVRERLDAGRERAVEGFDEGVVDVLSWVLDTETRARIYVHLRQHPDSTSEEVADGTGLYPSTVREALAELHAEGTVERGKRESDGAGNNPFEYRAIPPSALVRGAIGDVQDSLNAVFQMDRYMGDDSGGDVNGSDDEPVTITVDEADEGEATTGEDEDADGSEDATVDEDPTEAADEEQDEDIDESL